MKDANELVQCGRRALLGPPGGHPGHNALLSMEGGRYDQCCFNDQAAYPWCSDNSLTRPRIDSLILLIGVSLITEQI